MLSFTIWLRVYWKTWVFGSILAIGVLGYFLPGWIKMKPKDAIKLAVKEFLKAPATAQFVSVEILEHESQGYTQYYFGYVVVDAQNLYGALVRNRLCVIVLEEEGNGFKTTGVDGVIECPTTPWNEEERHAQKQLVGWVRH